MCASCASVRKSASRADASATRDVDGAGGIGRDLASIHRVYRPSAHSSLVYHRKWDEKHSRARLCDTSSAAAEMDRLDAKHPAINASGWEYRTVRNLQGSRH